MAEFKQKENCDETKITSFFLRFYFCRKCNDNGDSFKQRQSMHGKWHCAATSDLSMHFKDFCQRNDQMN